MKIGVYPGSFNPWHRGHTDIIEKALNVFDEIIIAQGVNPDKNLSDRERIPTTVLAQFHPKVRTAAYKGLLVDFLKSVNATAVIRGLRNGQDFTFEQTQQYWNEDLGIVIPTVYFVSDRSLVHISSSALRQLEKFKK